MQSSDLLSEFNLSDYFSGIPENSIGTIAVKSDPGSENIRPYLPGSGRTGKEIQAARRIASLSDESRRSVAFRIVKTSPDVYNFPGVTIRFVKSGHNADPVVFSVFGKLAGSNKSHPIGIVRSKSGKLHFRLNSLESYQDGIRLHFIACLKIGLRDQDSLKSGNCALSDHWLADPRLGSILGLNFGSPDHHSKPWIVTGDNRARVITRAIQGKIRKDRKDRADQLCHQLRSANSENSRLKRDNRTLADTRNLIVLGNAIRFDRSMPLGQAIDRGLCPDPVSYADQAENVVGMQYFSRTVRSEV
jgi:hypothetical protein